jgi:hypothetical protein
VSDYGLDGRGSIPDRQRIFPLTSASRLALGPTQPPIQWVPGPFSPGVKRGWGVMLTSHPHLSAEFKKEWELYLISPKASQPSKKLTKGGVRRRCETSSRVRSNHSRVLNALLEMVNDDLNWNWGFAYTAGFASQQKALTFQARGIADSGGGGYPIRQLIFVQGFWLDGFPGSWTQKCWGRFGWRPLRLGGDHFGLRPPWWGGGPCPFSHYALAFALQPRKSMENLSQGSRAARGLLVAPTWPSSEGQPRLSCWTSDHPGFPGDFSQPSVGTGAFRVTVLRGSPHQLTSSRNSRSMLWCGRRCQEGSLKGRFNRDECGRHTAGPVRRLQAGVRRGEGRTLEVSPFQGPFDCVNFLVWDCLLPFRSRMRGKCDLKN